MVTRDRRPCGWVAAALPLLMLFVLMESAVAQVSAPEYRVKAAFVFRFGEYIDWPAHAFESPGSPLRIGVLGATDFADELQRAVKDQTMAGRPVVVHTLADPLQLEGLQLIFVGRDGIAELGAIVDSVADRPVVLITESVDGTPTGSTINFVIVRDKVRFDITLREAESRGIRISARLLAVARKVTGRPT